MTIGVSRLRSASLSINHKHKAQDRRQVFISSCSIRDIEAQGVIYPMVNRLQHPLGIVKRVIYCILHHRRIFIFELKWGSAVKYQVQEM